MEFKNLTKEQLWRLRMEICLGSFFYSDYENSFGFDCHDVFDFFTEYVEFLSELNPDETSSYLKYDTEDNLWDYFTSIDDLSWVKNI